MNNSFESTLSVRDFPAWDKVKRKGGLLSFALEITARCNNNCTHCYINLPYHDKESKERELSFEEIKKITDEAVSMGAIWVLVTGGEPLLRDDFFDIYLYLKRKGLLVSVFTNATFITDEHIDLFREYPPNNIEVTVYGVTRETYEKITRRDGSFDLFMRGLDRLLKNGIKVRFKTMALRSNFHELPLISSFCRARTKDFFRFDPFLNLRFDGNQLRNKEIISERLLPEEIVFVEQSDSERSSKLKKNCDKLVLSGLHNGNCNHLFGCGAGIGTFNVSHDGFLRLCSSLLHPDCVYDLRKGSLAEALQKFIPKVRDMRSDREEFFKRCKSCALINLCMWCPGHAHLETGELDKPVDFFCEIANARAEAIKPKTASI
ncbi:radical SAM protein [Candidatus Omnitrophota bacterium]